MEISRIDVDCKKKYEYIGSKIPLMILLHDTCVVERVHNGKYLLEDRI